MSSGTLKITVNSGDLVGKGDSYVKLIYNGVSKETNVVKDTQKPKWETAFDFNVLSSDAERSVLVELWDISKNQLVGSGKLPNIDQYFNNKDQVTIPIKNGSSNEGSVVLLVKLVAAEGGAETRAQIDAAYQSRMTEGESGTIKHRKKKKRDDLGGSRGSLSSEGSLRGRGRRNSLGSLHGMGSRGSLASEGGHRNPMNMSRDHSGTLRYWEGASVGKSLSSTTGSTGTLRSSSSRRIRDPNHPSHNFIGGEDGSFSYTVDKYQTSPGPIYDVSGPIPIVDKNAFHATIGNEDRLKHFVTHTPGKGPADLLPNRESTSFQSRPFYATFGNYKAPSWAINKTCTREGPPESMPDPSVKSHSPHNPQYGIPRDGRDKYFEKKSLSQGPAAYVNNTQWTKPESGLGTIPKTERNTSSWIFGK